jgi:hypothetical protein
MNAFTLNLIKDQVPGFKQRRAIFWQMHLYVLLAGALLVYECFEATRDVIAHRFVLLEAQLIETDFRIDYDSENAMPVYLQEVSRNLSRQTQKMKSIESILDSKSQLSPLLGGIAKPLHPGMRLVRFELKGAGAFEFDIACSRESGATVDSGFLIDAWQEDALLSAAVKTIKPALVQRQLLESRGMMLLKYEGMVKTGAI